MGKANTWCRVCRRERRGPSFIAAGNHTGLGRRASPDAQRDRDRRAGLLRPISTRRLGTGASFALKKSVRASDRGFLPGNHPPGGDPAVVSPRNGRQMVILRQFAPETSVMRSSCGNSPQKILLSGRLARIHPQNNLLSGRLGTNLPQVICYQVILRQFSPKQSVIWAPCGNFLHQDLFSGRLGTIHPQIICSLVVLGQFTPKYSVIWWYCGNSPSKNLSSGHLPTNMTGLTPDASRCYLPATEARRWERQTCRPALPSAR